MQFQYLGDRIRGFYRVANLDYLCAMTTKGAWHRLTILQLFDLHGKTLSVMPRGW